MKGSLFIGQMKLSYILAPLNLVYSSSFDSFCDFKISATYVELALYSGIQYVPRRS